MTPIASPRKPARHDHVDHPDPVAGVDQQQGQQADTEQDVGNDHGEPAVPTVDEDAATEPRSTWGRNDASIIREDANVEPVST